MHKRSLLLAIAALLVSAVVAGYFARSAIATQLAAIALDHSHTLDCNRPVVTLGPRLESAIVSPLRCRIRTGPVTEFVSDSALVIELQGFRPRNVHVARASIDQRDRDL